MEFELQFDENIFREQNQIWFNSVWSKNIKKNRNGFFYGIPFILLGILIVKGGNELGFLFIGIGLFLIITAYRYYSHYKKRNKFYYDTIESEIEKYKLNKNSVFEFIEEYFLYKDYRLEVKYKWSIFRGFKLTGENLFIFFDIEKVNPYIIGKIEVGNENFDKIIEFLNKKKPLN